jgi:predicted DNA-binding transcriptional regulator AlpA
MGVSEESTVLSSWKDIAKYLGKGVRTVQRWEQHFGLPVRRPVGSAQKSAVLLYREDVDAWLATRFTARNTEVKTTSLVRDDVGKVRAELRANLQKASALRDTHQALAQQISDSIRLLSERCNSLTAQSAKAAFRTSPLAASGVWGNKRSTATEIVR